MRKEFFVLILEWSNSAAFHYHRNNLITDILSNVKKTDFQAFDFPYLRQHKKLLTNLFNLRKFIKNNKIDIL